MLAAVRAEVVIAGRNAEKLQAAARAVGPTVRPETVDAAFAESRAAFFARIGTIDHLVLTLTGRLGGGAFASLPLRDVRRAFDEKFWPYLETAQAALPTLSKRGSLTFVTGISARKVNPGGSGFAALNGALEAMMPTLAPSSRRCASTPSRPASSGRRGTIFSRRRRETYEQAAATGRRPGRNAGGRRASAALRPRHAVRHRLDHRMRRRRAADRCLSAQ
jgi:NADP-dependent 3-hydroxy acid dehydrogenase YdfG